MISEFNTIIPVFEMKDIKIEIPADVQEIKDMFTKYSKKLYLVGGAVRDTLSGEEPKDWDLATDATPDEILDMARKEGLKTLEVGKTHGVVLINGHEIATFRKDIGRGRRPDSVEYTDIETDVNRRDLTVNALFYDLDKEEIVDLVGGAEDLKNNVIRTVGDPADRFDEDPLRKLRALRFYGRTGGTMHEDTYKALKDDPTFRTHKNEVSGERIRDEFIKGIKKAKSPKRYLEMIDELNMMPEIFPNVEINKDFIDENDYQLQLAYLFKDFGVDKIADYLNELHYTNKEIDNVKFLISMLDFDPKNIYDFKKMQSRTTLTDEQIMRWGEIIGQDFSKFLKFNLTLGGKDLPPELKPEERGGWLKDQEAKKFNDMLKHLSNFSLPLFEDYNPVVGLEQLWNIYITFVEGLDGKIISEEGELNPRYWKDGVEAELDRITGKVKTLGDVEEEQDAIKKNLADLVDGLEGVIVEQGDFILQYFKPGIFNKAKRLVNSWQ